MANSARKKIAQAMMDAALERPVGADSPVARLVDTDRGAAQFEGRVVAPGQHFQLGEALPQGTVADVGLLVVGNGAADVGTALIEPTELIAGIAPGLVELIEIPGIACFRRGRFGAADEGVDILGVGILAVIQNTQDVVHFSRRRLQRDALHAEDHIPRLLQAHFRSGRDAPTGYQGQKENGRQPGFMGCHVRYLCLGEGEKKK
jgi:hypothetical protein